MTPKEELTEAKSKLEDSIQESIEEFSEDTGFVPYAVEINMIKTPLFPDLSLCYISSIIVKIKL